MTVSYANYNDRTFYKPIHFIVAINFKTTLEYVGSHANAYPLEETTEYLKAFNKLKSMGFKDTDIEVIVTEDLLHWNRNVRMIAILKTEIHI